MSIYSMFIDEKFAKSGKNFIFQILAVEFILSRKGSPGSSITCWIILLPPTANMSIKD